MIFKSRVNTTIICLSISALLFFCGCGQPPGPSSGQGDTGSYQPRLVFPEDLSGQQNLAKPITGFACGEVTTIEFNFILPDGQQYGPHTFDCDLHQAIIYGVPVGVDVKVYVNADGADGTEMYQGYHKVDILQNETATGDVQMVPLNPNEESNNAPDDETNTNTNNTGLDPLPVWQRTRGTNTQNLLPNNLFLADINGDLQTDFVQFSGSRIFVKRMNFEQTEILDDELERPISRLFTGYFNVFDRHNICVIFDNNSLRCYVASPDNNQLISDISQNNFISAQEDIIAADFDGNGHDDLFLYNRESGLIRMYTIRDGDSQSFTPMPNFIIGNLDRVAEPGVQFRPLEYHGSEGDEARGDGRVDLLAVNSQGHIYRFASVNDADGMNTFWWAVTIHSGASIVGENEELTVARITDDSVDDIVIHNKVTGVYRFYSIDYDNQGLIPITDIDQGQLAVQTNSLLFWVRAHGTNLNEPGAEYRDDAAVIDVANRLIRKSDGRWDGEGYTYWWRYNQYLPDDY